MYKCKDTQETVETYGEYLKTKHWDNIKQLMFKTYLYQCSVCGGVQKLQVHHKTYERIGDEDMNDLVYLCKACHRLMHENEALFVGCELSNTKRKTKTKRKRLFTRQQLNQFPVWHEEHEKIIKERIEKRAKNKRPNKKTDKRATQRTGVYLDTIVVEHIKQQSPTNH